MFNTENTKKEAKALNSDQSQNSYKVNKFRVDQIQTAVYSRGGIRCVGGVTSPVNICQELFISIG
jgi:hypothetical protein